MENDSPFETRIREYFAGNNRYGPPPANAIRARKMLIKNVSQSADPLLLIASFLNLRVKLYHAVIAFLLIWLTVILFSERGDSVRQEQAVYSGPSPLAAVNEGTVPACIKTFIER